MSDDERDSCANLILLCRTHHKEIDDPTNGEEIYPSSRLIEIKIAHEEWVRERLDFDESLQLDSEAVAQLIDEWETRCSTAFWREWTSWIFGGGGPQISVEMSERLRAVRQWLLNRIWPDRYFGIQAALDNFRNVLEVFHTEFLRHAIPQSDMLFTETFYKSKLVSEQEYYSLLRKYTDHADLVQDLALELTRAANLIVDSVRAELLPGYRTDEGYFLVEAGPLGDLSFATFLTRYSAEQANSISPFKGREVLIREILSRDRHFLQAEQVDRICR